MTAVVGEKLGPGVVPAQSLEPHRFLCQPFVETRRLALDITG